MPWICFFLVVDVITEHLKVRREAQDAKRQAEEAKKEAEMGPVKTAEDTAESSSQLDDAEHKEDAGSQGKGELQVCATCDCS